ncbi:hypothetical protein GQ600_17228 [Phytophthora cactorum]|nr:hypothetical protein GQ600_17228 [Phytophthora cactorum]
MSDACLVYLGALTRISFLIDDLDDLFKPSLSSGDDDRDEDFEPGSDSSDSLLELMAAFGERLFFRIFVSDQYLNDGLHTATYRCNPCATEKTRFVLVEMNYSYD